jgi:large subunit ribosomal protein L18
MRIVGVPKSGAQRRHKRHLRIRNKITGTAERPRLVVFRSLKHIYAQIVDDTKNRTLLTVSDLSVEQGKKSERAAEVGRQLAERAKTAGISRVVFDRAGYRYHGRIKAVADGARKGGLEF